MYQKRTNLIFICLPKRIYMVIAILEPVATGTMVSLKNSHVLNNLSNFWHFCTAEEVLVDEHEHEEDASSMNTTISDADVHVHCH